MMVVAPNLTWPILFGQNHLRQADARIYSKDLRELFADPAMNFEVKCYDTNLNDSFIERPSTMPHVPSPILAQFKELLHKYPHVFHLPNSPLSTIKGFYHNIDMG